MTTNVRPAPIPSDDAALAIDLEARATLARIKGEEFDAARRRRDRYVREALERGWSLRRVADLTGLSFKTIALIRDKEVPQ